MAVSPERLQAVAWWNSCRNREACGRHQRMASLRQGEPCGRPREQMLPSAAPAFPKNKASVVSGNETTVINTATLTTAGVGQSAWYRARRFTRLTWPAWLACVLPLTKLPTPVTTPSEDAPMPLNACESRMGEDTPDQWLSSVSGQDSHERSAGPKGQPLIGPGAGQLFDRAAQAEGPTSLRICAGWRRPFSRACVAGNCEVWLPVCSGHRVSHGVAGDQPRAGR